MRRFLEIVCVGILHLLSPLLLPFFGVYLLARCAQRKSKNKTTLKLQAEQ